MGLGRIRESRPGQIIDNPLLPRCVAAGAGLQGVGERVHDLWTIALVRGSHDAIGLVARK
jgi:hypothetical protein